MNREIKFRAFDKESKEMLYEGHNEKTNGSSFYASKTTLFMLGEQAEIMQYTGLKDKSGKDIYEGDILRKFYSRDVTGKDVVIWNEAVEFEADHEGSGFKISFLETAEIIGNIYEHPHLLKS